MVFRDVFSAEDVEEFGAFEVGGFGFTDGGEDLVVGDGIWDDEGDIASDGGVGREGFEVAVGNAASNELVEVEFREEDRVTEVEFLADSGLELAKFAELYFAADRD